MFEGTIASLTPTVCRLLRITAPTLTSEPYLASVNERALATLGDNSVQRCLVYCPDALGDHLWSRFSDEAAAVAEHCPQRIRLSSVVPPKTPVCALPRSLLVRRQSGTASGSPSVRCLLATRCSTPYFEPTGGLRSARFVARASI